MDEREDHNASRDQHGPLLDRECDQPRRLIQRTERAMDHRPPPRGRRLRREDSLRFAARGGGDDAGIAFGGFCLAGRAGGAWPASRPALLVTLRAGGVTVVLPYAAAGPFTGAP